MRRGWRGQLAEALDRGLTTYERLMPFKRAADAHRHASAAIQAAQVRARLKGLLPAMLADDPPAFETVDLLLSFETWQRLRLDQELTPEEARAVVEGAVRRTVEA